SRKGAKTQSVSSPRATGSPREHLARGAIKGKKSKDSTPHQFPPTLGDVDLHLFGEGRHERIYEKLGAHLITHQGKRGVAFAVWAPNARRVSVVGDFNDWNGAKDHMRMLGNSGVWELFIPGLREG